MADPLKDRISLLQEAEAQALARGKTLKPEAQAELDRYRAQGLVKGPKGPSATNPAAISAMKNDEIIAAIDNARSLAKGGWSTGLTGQILGRFGGTDAADLQAPLETIEGNLTIDNLMNLKSASSTGASGFGSLTEREGRLLAASVASLKQNQSQEQFLKNLDMIERHYRTFNALNSGEDPNQPDVQKKYKILPLGSSYDAPQTPPNSPAGGPPDETGKYAGADIQMHMDSPENAQGYRFTPTQETALHEYLTSGNATPEGYGRMMTAFAAAQGVNVDDAYTQSATAQGQKLIEAAKAGKLGDGMSYNESDKNYRDRLLAEQDKKPLGDMATGQLLTSGVTAGLNDEISGVVGGAKSFLEGKGFQQGYRHDRDTVRAVRDRAYEERPIISGATEMLGALATPGGVARDVMRGGTLAERIAAGAKAGGRQGIAAGYGYGEGAGDSVKGAAIGGATGALIGGGLPIAAKGLSSAYGFATNRPAITAVRDATERLNINSTPATTGGPVSQGIQMAYGNLPGSSAAVEKAATRETGDLANAARTVANDLGPVSTPKGAGKAISRGAGAWQRVTRREAQRLYGERDRLMGGPDVPIPMVESRVAIDSFAQRFPNSPVLATLRESPAVRRLEKALPDKGVLTLKESTEILSEARAALRNARRNGAVTPAMETRIAEVEQAIENDVLNAARQVDQAAGRTTGGAADAQMTADKYYRNRAILKSGALKLPLSSRTDDVLASSEAVYRDISGDMAEKGGNFAKLQATWKALPTGAKRNFAATKFDEMGKATNGQQNADKTAWSFNTFLTNYSSLDKDARKLVFGAQEDKIRDIATYAERLRQVDKSRNFSNTAKNTIAGVFMTVLGGALWKGDVQTAAATVAAVPAAWGSAKLFLSTPAMRTWTARALKATQQAANTGNAKPLQSLTGQLTGIAAREPAISGDVISLQNYLAAKFSETPSRAAATPGQDRNDRRPPPENNGQ